jgi:type VI protein secretion system component VasK
MSTCRFCWLPLRRQRLLALAIGVAVALIHDAWSWRSSRAAAREAFDVERRSLANEIAAETGAACAAKGFAVTKLTDKLGA